MTNMAILKILVLLFFIFLPFTFAWGLVLLTDGWVSPEGIFHHWAFWIISSLYWLTGSWIELAEYIINELL